MFEQLTQPARSVIVKAERQAHALCHASVGPEHLLLGLLDERDGIAARALAAFSVTTENAATQLKMGDKRSTEIGYGYLPFTPQAKIGLDRALRESSELGHTYIGTEHLLLGMVRSHASGTIPTNDTGNTVVKALQDLGVDLPRLREYVLAAIGNTPASPPSSEDQAAPSVVDPESALRDRVMLAVLDAPADKLSAIMDLLSA